MFKLFDAYFDKAERGLDALPFSQIYLGMIIAMGVICFLALMFPLFIIGTIFGRAKQ